MHYHVVYDITQTDFPRFQLFAPVIMGLFGLGLILVAWLGKGIHPFSFMRAIVPTVVAALVWSFSYVMTQSRYHHYQEVKSAMQKSQCDVIEGAVTGFRQLPAARRSRGETFMVNGTEFEYREGSAQAGFHQPGIIRDGMHVRIYYYAGNDLADTRDIARLEIAD
jgi:hypothetical protein